MCRVEVHDGDVPRHQLAVMGRRGEVGCPEPRGGDLARLVERDSQPPACRVGQRDPADIRPSPALLGPDVGNVEIIDRGPPQPHAPAASPVGIRLVGPSSEPLDAIQAGANLQDAADPREVGERLRDDGRLADVNGAPGQAGQDHLVRHLDARIGSIAGPDRGDAVDLLQ